MIGYVGEDCWKDICDECIDPDCACACHDPDGDDYVDNEH